jgi:hypothetical protein
MTASPFVVPQARRTSIAVDVGGVMVGRRRAGRRPVDDQHRHGGYRRHGRPGRGASSRRLRDRAHHRRPRRERRRRSEDPRAAGAARHRRAAGRRLSIISATSFWPIIPPAPRPSRSTASIPAMSASRTRSDRQFTDIIEMAIHTTNRCASASTGGRSTRCC